MSVTGWANLSGSTVKLTVEIDFSQAVSEINTPLGYTGSSTWDSATWDDSAALWNGNAPVYTDVTQWVRSIGTNQGFSRNTNKFNTSIASLLLDNSDGRFSPMNTSSPYRVGGVTAIGPMRPARISVETDSSTYAIFTGLVQAWSEEYPDFGGDAVVNVSLVGLEARLGDYTRYPQTATGAGESAQSRIQRILQSVNFTGDMYLSPGTFPLQATTLEGNALDELQLVADSESGYLWFGPNGECNFYDASQTRIQLNTFNTYEFTSGAPGENCASFNYSEIDYAYDGELTKNIMSYQRVGGTVQTLVDNNSRALYGDRAVTRTDLVCTTDAAAQQIAGKDLALLKTPDFRVESIVVDARAQSTLSWLPYSQWESLFNVLGLRNSCHVILDNRVGKAMTGQMRRDVLISAISHSITPDSWKVKLEFTTGTVLAKMRDTQWDGYFYWDSGVWSW